MKVALSYHKLFLLIKHGTKISQVKAGQESKHQIDQDDHGLTLLVLVGGGAPLRGDGSVEDSGQLVPECVLCVGVEPQGEENGAQLEVEPMEQGGGRISDKDGGHTAILFDGGLETVYKNNAFSREKGTL